jgi:pilus assembly protein Flp/PilA
LYPAGSTPDRVAEDGSQGNGFSVQAKDKVMKTLIRMLKDNSGAAAAEYALILAIVGAGIAAAAFALGEDIAGAMGNAGDCISNVTANSTQC